MNKKPPPTIIIDTREQRPYEFSCPTVTRKLNAGDYSIEGMETMIAIERKSLDDFTGTVTWGRERFMRELELLKVMRWAWIVVEAEYFDIYLGLYSSKVHEESMLGSTASLCICHVPVLFAGNREAANDLTERLLRFAWQQVQKESPSPPVGSQ